jgi:ABC-2 type transport system ATP-binding protein
MMIEVKNLTKRFGKVTAIKDLSFHIKKGEIVGLLGSNGAGKTTTLRILACYLSASGGEALVGGEDIFRDSFAVRQKIGYLPENVPLYPDMRVVEYLQFRGELKDMHGSHLRRRILAVLEQCNLVDKERSIIRNLSKGFRQRVGLADCLLHEPECLILDEPTIGLDPNQIRHIRELIRLLSEEYTVLISTHILSEVEMLCERVLIMDGGRIVASDSPEALVGLMKGNERVVAEICGPRDDVIKAVESVDGVESLICETSEGWNRLVCQCEKGSDARTGIFEVASKQSWKLRELSVERQNLEDVFVEITGGSGARKAEKLKTEKTETAKMPEKPIRIASQSVAGELKG